ncbi:Ppx/GppA phosphatase family protein [Egicoccus sp. AB-alg2]|uniref:Ppx/GppA phosphatase family protein n=1 Tax=Egicoccus sp. AB-alg2 TaxID=3242693 RepID=UPI00359F0B17
MRASVLDLGSNSFHVLVAEMDDGRVVPVLRQREMLHLGAVVARHGAIPADARQHAAATAGHLADLARRSGATEVTAVATAALRDADNGPEVLAAMEAATGVPVRVLPGLDEARLSYLGVRASVAVDVEPVLVLDLGGGSLEFAVGRGSDVDWAASTPLGGSRSSALLEQDPPSEADRRRLVAAVDAEVVPLVDEITRRAPATVVALGGTVRALARLVAVEDGMWLPAESVTNHLGLTTGQLRRVRDRLLALDYGGRLDVPGMKDTRADHIHVAAVILVEVFERLGIERVTVSDWGLREGLLLDAMGVTKVLPGAELRRREVERVATTFLPGDPHPGHVAELAGLLFDELVDLHGLGDDDRELLQHAARLHTVGEALALRRSHRHGAYLVENAELRGFPPHDVAMLVTLVRFHGARGVDRRFAPAASLDGDRRERLERLLPLLQLADVLDRARDQAVHDVHANDDGEVVTLAVVGDPHLDAADLGRRLAWFQRVYDRRLALVDAESGAAHA